MPVLAYGGLEIEYADAGDGPAVVLIHCSVSGLRQWRSLTEVLADRYRVRALNLYGYGATTPWPAQETQTLEAQARIVVAACAGLGEPVALVGHSFGGTVALKAATLLGSSVGSMVLIEPNPVYLLAQGGRDEEFAEVRALRDHVKRFGALGDWEAVAERFADYWVGDGAWDAMPETRRAAFTALLPPNFHEWDAAMGEGSTVEHLAGLGCRTLVLSDPATRRPIRAIAEILAQACPDWRFRDIPAGGHMAPLTRPDLVNPMVCAFLDAG
jgi:pimeloyl-ACP methyl ester carboxylesterase